MKTQLITAVAALWSCREQRLSPLVVSDGNEPLNASHETFGAKKPILVFSCLGNGVEIEDLHVWTQKL